MFIYNQLENIFSTLKAGTYSEDDYFGFDYIIHDENDYSKIIDIMSYRLGFEDGLYYICSIDNEYSFESLDDLFNNFTFPNRKKLSDDIDIEFDV